MARGCLVVLRQMGQWLKRVICEVHSFILSIGNRTCAGQRPMWRGTRAKKTSRYPRGRYSPRHGRFAENLRGCIRIRGALAWCRTPRWKTSITTRHRVKNQAEPTFGAFIGRHLFTRVETTKEKGLLAEMFGEGRTKENPLT